MPKTYSEKERAEITARLKSVANELMMEKGVKKATVDEIVKRAGIPKGTFYLFYPSKEMLFFDVAQDFHTQVDEHISLGLSRIIEDNKLDPSRDGAFAEYIDDVTDVILGAMDITFSSCLKVLLEPEAMKLILSKLPDEVLEEHRDHDKHMGAGIIEMMATQKGLSVGAVVGSFTMILFGGMYKQVIGEENLRESMRMLIKGVIGQILI